MAVYPSARTSCWPVSTSMTQSTLSSPAGVARVRDAPAVGRPRQIETPSVSSSVRSVPVDSSYRWIRASCSPSATPSPEAVSSRRRWPAGQPSGDHSRSVASRSGSTVMSRSASLHDPDLAALARSIGVDRRGARDPERQPGHRRATRPGMAAAARRRRRSSADRRRFRRRPHRR